MRRAFPWCLADGVPGSRLGALSPTLLSRIEDAGLNASAPPQQRWVDGWLVRFSPGKAQRARCVNALAAGQATLDERLAYCAALYEAHGLPLVVRITPFTQPPDLDGRLAALGFARHDDTAVMVCADVAHPRQSDLPAGLHYESVSSEAYAYIVGEFRNSPPSACEAHAQRLTASPVPYRALVIRDADGSVVAGAQSAREAQMVGLYDVFTVPNQRGRGLASGLCRNLLAQAREDGASMAYLQVDVQNDPARSIYRRLGFSDAYGYHYRVAPARTG